LRTFCRIQPKFAPESEKNATVLFKIEALYSRLALEAETNTSIAGLRNPQSGFHFSSVGLDHHAKSGYSVHHLARERCLTGPKREAGHAQKTAT
jgi:hypothetical protein